MVFNLNLESHIQDKQCYYVDCSMGIVRILLWGGEGAEFVSVKLEGTIDVP